MNRFVFCLLVVLTTGLMESSFIIGKMPLAYSSPLLLVALRFTLAEIIMVIVVGIFIINRKRNRETEVELTRSMNSKAAKQLGD